ncbi:MAG TPA: hypothetical protein VGN15_04585, partial [Ktedonobacteraceae bacterium]|nr:hypothetical protein [Ktedonobacteraceae bacterium]
MYAPYSHLRPAFLLLLLSGLLVQGCGSATVTSTATPAQATIAAAGAVSATTLSGGAPTPASGPLTWDDGSRAVAIHPLTADANLIVLGFTVEDRSLSTSQNRQIVWVASPISVTTIDGVQLPALESETGWQWSPSGGATINGSSSANTGKGNASDGAGQDALIGTRAAFDASLLSTVSKSVRLRVVT